MKEVVEEWLGRQAQVVGVLACGVRLPDEAFLMQTPAAGYPRESLENALRCVADTFEVLKLNEFPHQQLRWVFQNALLYCVGRGDGAYLGILTGRDPGQVDLPGIERMVQEFGTIRGASGA